MWWLMPLSRDKCEMAWFITQVSDENATTIPDEIVAMLIEEYPCWSEREWRRMRTFCSGRV